MIDHIPPLIVSGKLMLLPHEALAREIRQGLCVECRRRAHLVANGVSTPLFAHSPTHLHTAALGRDPETRIHRAARIRLTEIIQDMLRNGNPVLIGYRCPTCGRQRSVNVLAGISAVVTGRTLKLPQGSVNPDISLIRRGELAAVIEVVGSHPVPARKMAIFENARVLAIEAGVHVAFSRRPARSWVAVDGQYQVDLHPSTVAAGRLCRVHWHPPSCSKHGARGFRRNLKPHIILQEVSGAKPRCPTNRGRVAV